MHLEACKLTLFLPSDLWPTQFVISNHHPLILVYELLIEFYLHLILLQDSKLHKANPHWLAIPSF